MSFSYILTGTLLSLLIPRLAMAQVGGIPVGLKPIFNGTNLTGWHLSRTTHQGATPDVRVEEKAIVLRQQPYGQGGLLLSDKKYKSFDLYVEVKVDSFCNSGIFLRSSEGGSAYQIELEEPGNTGSLLGERINVSQGAKATNRLRVWKAGDWNSFRVRMEGEIPHLTLWINGVEMWDVTQPKNDFIAGATEGMIGLQCHWVSVYSPAVIISKLILPVSDCIFTISVRCFNVWINNSSILGWTLTKHPKIIGLDKKSVRLCTLTYGLKGVK